VRICLVYDHLFPQTIGGAERWLRDLAVRLAAAGHDVTYLTMRHWEAAAPSLPGVHVQGLTRPGRIYEAERRTLSPPIRFGAAVARHLARHGREYDVVHVGSFPFFSVLASGTMRKTGGYRLFVDWYEVWTRAYWRHYAGAFTGTIGWLVQRACVRMRHRAFCLSRLAAERLVAEGYDGLPVILPGIYAGPVEPAPASDVDSSLVVYAGRLVREKRVPALVHAVASLRAQRSDLRLDIYGEGPERGPLARLVKQLGLEESVHIHGHCPENEVAEALARSACVATASEREGYGLVVVEAAARGTPSVVVAGSENAATDLVAEGVNGAVAESADAEEVARAIQRVLTLGPTLRASTVRWFKKNAATLKIDASLDLVLQVYSDNGGTRLPSAVAS
jgi:glycosyltransferase involved in cell wall biosynthesis